VQQPERQRQIGAGARREMQIRLFGRPGAARVHTISRPPFSFSSVR